MKTQLLSVLFVATTLSLSAQISTFPDGGNQKSEVTQWIGPVKVTITYNSPDVHGPDGADRTGHIWGELVPYGFVDQGFGTSKSSPWRAGANENTTIEFSHDVKIEGKDLKAGKYGFFVVPEKEGPWTIIFSKDSESWGSYFYDEKNDALRTQVRSEESSYSEWLTYGFDNRMYNSTVAYLQWEKKKIPFKIEVPNVNEIQLGIIENQLKNAQGFDYNSWKDAALFCMNNNLSLDKALYFAESAISMPFIGVENFATLKVKAQVLKAMNRKEESDKTMQQALNHSSATLFDLHSYGRQLLREGKNQEAVDVFKLNQKRHPDDKFTTYVGLARGYTAIGDKKNAIKNWEIAIKNLPEDQKTNLAYYQGELEKLKS